MNYWIDMFTGTTWDEFRKAGAKICGFNAVKKKAVGKIQPGDILLCYLTGVSRWVGALEAVGPSGDTSNIWAEAQFPIRLAIKPLVLLDPEHGIVKEQVLGKVRYFQEQQGLFIQGSPNQFKFPEDGKIIFDLLQEAKERPVLRPLDHKKLAKPIYFSIKKKNKAGRQTELKVTLPEPASASNEVTPSSGAAADSYQHTEIQYHLLKLGAEMGLKPWVAKNDQGKSWNEKPFANIEDLAKELPPQLGDTVAHAIGLIDVLWIKNKAVTAAFEIESTTQVYSGLLRMSDLLAVQPNLSIKLFIVAPDERYSKVKDEILRPTFQLLEKPLHTVCGFISFSKLMKAVKSMQDVNLIKALDPEKFLQGVAEYFEPETNEEE